jgi:uncharacterized protein YecE (DUF72 family)
MAVPATGRIRIGCSGWQYRDWRGRFYPVDLPARRWLPYYAERFDTVEVNNSFYRLPQAETFAVWREATPPDFVLAVKASRFLTHIKRLRDPGPPLALLFQRALALGRKLGPVLYQLPPTQRYDAERLRTFLAALPRRAADVPGPARPASILHLAPPRQRLLHAIEFRDPSWYRTDVFESLAGAGVALCLHDKAGSELDADPGGPFFYVRFHGTSGRYHGSYPRQALAAWAPRLRAAAEGGRDVYVYFNNDVGGAAVRNARMLKRLVDST